ncbi:LysM peptidoglycan-binding domain-containing protein [Aspergillus lucknowensis]|uniref:LysM domain-containing protein n=1 Tax=Aspergillus lucknowensis TaxID=176173 RepID=A0ABR4LWU4_9EURO
MHLAYLLVPGLATALSRRAVECDYTTIADAGATCQSFASNWGISVETLQQLNPGIACPDLATGQSYCVIGTVNDDPSSTPTVPTSNTPTPTPTPTPAPTFTTTTSTRTTASTEPPTPTGPSPTNSPTMPGIADDCDGFHKVSSGDQCDTIAAQNGITVDQLMSWNSEIDDDCSNLWLDYYVCVHVPGAATTLHAPEPTEDPSEPQPQMPGIAEDCAEFHLIEDGDSCSSICADAGITFEEFREWNSEVDEDCTNLWLDYYVCIGV